MSTVLSNCLKRVGCFKRPLIEKYNGKWIKELGDGVLASFQTVTDSVNCACDIIKGCESVNGLNLRIGIHQAEVVFEDGDVFGDGVNIASRLIALAPVGGICISETVRNNVANRKEINTRFIREEMLKHVKEPVRIYEVITDRSAMEKHSSAPANPALSVLKQQKRIAVLPFINMSSDPEQEFFSDGLTEEIIADLSGLQTLMVISRSSIMTFKGTNKKLKEIAEDVNVRYILEGSVRRAGNNLRITAQLIDAINDTHLWAEKYNGTIDDIFDIQEKVSRSIVEALNLRLTSEEEYRLSKNEYQNTQAYECYIRASQEMWKFTEQGLNNVITLSQQGLDVAGDNPVLYATMSTAYFFFHHYGLRPHAEYLEKAYLYADKSFSDGSRLPPGAVC